MTGMKRALAGIATVAAIVAPACWAASGTPASGASGAVFAVVDGAAISAQEFDNELAATIRQKFFHRRPPEDQLAALRREVGDNLINRVLLLKEARRRGVRADEEQVRVKIAAYEQRNRSRPQWQENRAKILPELARALEQQSMVTQLEAATRVAPPPTEGGLRAYYDSHPEQFTQPEQLRLSVILLKVDPAAPAAAWEQTLRQAQDIVKQLANGADFAALARQHSGDGSSSKGGDMGFQHRGTLSQGIETVIDKMAPGATSEPQRLLEGVAIFRLAERKPAQLKTLEEVRGNVVELWTREQAETQWRGLLARLRAGADIKIVAAGVRAAAGDGGRAGRPAAH